MTPATDTRLPTRRQREVLEFVREYWDEHGQSPTYREIADHFELSALATVHEHVKALEAKGHLQQGHYNEERRLIPTGTACPACGRDLPAWLDDLQAVATDDDDYDRGVRFAVSHLRMKLKGTP